MKSTYSRRYRRSASRSRETAMFKKDSHQEQAFFGTASPQSFFKPNTPIFRKCDHCEAEDKQVKRMGEKKEEEKLVNKMDEKKEEDKSVHKMEEKKEEKPIQKMEEKKEEKPVQKMEEKKEEKPVQRMEEKKEEKPIQKMEEKKEEDKSIQKAEEKKEEKKVAAKQDPGTGKGQGQADAYIHALPGKGSSLPGETQEFFRQRMGYDFSNVKIHNDAAAHDSAKDLKAKAYAVDNNIVFNKGQFNPVSDEGKKLLAHELTHVAQQQGNGQTVLKSADEQLVNRKEEASHAVASSGKAKSTPGKIAFGCEGVEVQGQTEANYTDSFSSSGSAKPSEKCEDCAPPECVSAKGTLVSVFKANPVVTLPSVPDGLSECETKAVAKFINTTLKNHEQKHVAAFKTYNATIKTPYTFTGCQSDLDAHIKSIHDNINDKRLANANAKSDKLDPFNPTIPCNCKD